MRREDWSADLLCTRQIDPNPSREAHARHPLRTGVARLLQSRQVLLIAFAFTVMGDPVSSVAYATGQDLRQLTYPANGSQSLTPVWSPNGQEILFQREFFHGSTPTGGALYTVARNGRDLDRVTGRPAFVFVQGGAFFYSWGTARP